ncbi:hypothetical protein [Segetibacter koreensis]|uniref:hypothetical protein n=1 Tax=Segetibacter koreensis TaxID=398037 RepID=UPI00036C5FD8|nr:hypothetical protein [Segetibacter koreensis]
MFISSSYLEINYGVNDEIAKFFVDREPPANNLYWKDKLLYLRPAAGYLFIPLIVDLLYRLGIDKQQLISEEFVTTMEQVGHISALEETKQITKDDAISKSVELVKEICKDIDWYNNVINYLANNNNNFFTNLSVPFKALQRGDLFLFSVCALSFAPVLNERIAEQWFALISTLLLLDDAEDIEADKETGDENAFIESGLDASGLKKVEELVETSIKKISGLNRAMGIQLMNQYQQYVGKLKHLLV